MLLGVLVTLGVGGIVRLGLLDSMELHGYDLLASVQTFAPARSKLVIVDFDDASVEALNAFPIPRGLLARVVERIFAGGPALIGLDVLLDKERDSQDDYKLSVALADAGNVVLAEVFGSNELPPSKPLPQFRKAAFDVGFVNLPVDKDGFVRRMFLWMRTPDYEGLSFPAVLASNYLQQPLQPVRPGVYRLGSTYILSDGISPSSTMIRFWSPTIATTVTVRRLFDPGFDPALFKGKIVLVGQSSTAAKDLYPTPVFRFNRQGDGGALLSGIEIHAAALATLLSGRTVRVLPGAQLWAINFLFACVFIALVVLLRPVYSLPAVVAGIIGSYLAGQLLFTNFQVWMKFVSTLGTALLALPAGLGYRFLEERRLKASVEAERRELMSLFERYVSPEVAAEIWVRRAEIVLVGQEKTATVLFSDIRSFTALTAGKPSTEVLTWLNSYFTVMSEVIRQNGGFLNKFIGDGLMVLFGVPLSAGMEKDACRAVQAALHMLQGVERLNGERAAGEPQLQIGIGLHTGPLTVGNVGARDRLEYSVIGETVNLASRLEALTKDFKTGIVLSPQTAELVRDRFEIVPLGEVTVRGFTDRITVYSVRSKRGSGATP